MAHNIETKARAADFERQCRLAAAAADGEAEVLHQRDVFFHVPKGRLKLRYLRPDFGQLVSYERPDQEGPKSSKYELFSTHDPARLEITLAGSLPIRGVVEKKRTLYMVGQTRIHCDEVAGLGQFLELEVVMRQGQTVEDGEAVARDLMQRLEIEPGHLIDAAYMDLLEKGE